MHMVILPIELDQHRFEVGADLREDWPQHGNRVSRKHIAPILRHEDQVCVEVENAMPPSTNLACFSHRPNGIIAS